MLTDKIFKHQNINRKNASIRIGLDGDGGSVEICSSAFDITKAVNICHRKEVLDASVT